MTQAAESVSVVVERDIPHPPEKVWRALTQPHLISEWLMENDFQPVVGHRFNMRWENNGASGVIDSEVLRIEPQRTLAYTWSSMGAGTVVTLTLTPTTAGTHLKMEQSGFAPDRPQNIQGARWGWTNFLSRLDEVAAKA